MISYVEKGPGLHVAIARAGHSLECLDGTWIASDDVAVQAIIDAYTLDQAKAEKSLRVALHAKMLRDRVIADYSPAEMSSWPIKLSEAAKYAESHNAADAPLLSAEAAVRGITLDAMMGKVGGNAQTFSALEAQIAGIDGKHRDAIGALMTFEAVAAYDYGAGWPVV